MEGCGGALLAAAGAYALISGVGLPLWALLKRTLLAPKPDWRRLGAGAGGWAVVTGASMGMGREYALQLAARGLHVVLIADPGTRAELEAVAAQITAGGAVRAVAIVEDLLDPAAYARIEAALQPMAADVSVLVNNVGMCVLNTLDATPEETCEKMLRLNTIPMVRLTKMLLPHMQASKRRGLVLNMASISGHIPTANMVVYAATKRFVLNFSDSLRAELQAISRCNSRNITVLAIAPFGVRTPMMANISRLSPDPSRKLLDGVVNPDAMVRHTLRKAGTNGDLFGHDIHELLGTLSLISRSRAAKEFYKTTVHSVPVPKLNPWQQ